MSKDNEIEMTDNIENMLRQEVYIDSKYIIRRDGQALLPKERGEERRRLQLYAKHGPSKTAREIVNADAIVLNKETKTVEAILEYEVNTNPKNIAGNFLAPFIADQYESSFEEDSGEIYRFDSTKLLVIVWLSDERDDTPRGRAPLEKGEIVTKSLAKIKKQICKTSQIQDAVVVISGNLDELVDKTKCVFIPE